MKISVLLPTPPRSLLVIQALVLTFHDNAVLRSFRNIRHKRFSTHTSDAGNRDYSHVRLTETHRRRKTI
ncbi:hypothetical protein QQF64_003132 [Cirrhinus molitorella]|uniref:Secreted protein n=1 Tax=Cirrhinus molitorella TaxID=172907 RepID=A0ABR3MK15_9TELE